MPIPRNSKQPLIDGHRLNAAGMWRYAGWPVAHNASGDVWVLGESASVRADALTSLIAPDFELADLNGQRHRLSDYRGRKVFMVTWASWCGCRMELPKWQSLYQELKERGFTVLAIALDEADAARPWIEAAAPGFPCLIDSDHITADLYNLVNVPQAVWIDEAGQIVRPPETAGMTDSFRVMDRNTYVTPQAASEERERVKKAYMDAIRDWTVHGAASPFVLDTKAVTARITVPDAAIANAHAYFRLGQALLRDKQSADAEVAFAEATRLHPDSWAMWRQNAKKNARGLATDEEFWRRVDALGDRPYYTPADLGSTNTSTVTAISDNKSETNIHATFKI